MKALSATQLVPQLRKAAERYEKLRSLFGDFCVKSASLLTANNAPVQGIKHFVDLPGNKLRVEFCGKPYEFHFEINHATGKGVVTCSLPDRTAQKDRIVVAVFTFTGTADSDVSNGDGDLLRMDSPGDASHLILHMIHQDVTAQLAPR
jgi:hypothetical protein